jgi:tetratricopeptide (TPR) repeat protein
MTTETGSQAQRLADVQASLAGAVSGAARQYELLGQAGKAVRLLKSMLEFSDWDGSPQGKALLLADLGSMIWKQGHFDEALELLAEAKALVERTEDRPLLATALYHLGELAYVRKFMMQAGELEEALVYHERCLAIRREVQDQVGVTLSLSRIGVLHERMEEYEVAMAYHEQAIELAEEIGYPLGTIRPCTHIGGSHRRRGDLDTALTFYQRALAISRQAGSHEDTLFGLINVGWAKYLLDGDSETALSHFQSALEMAEQTGFKFAIGRAYAVLAETYLSEGDSQQALAWFEKLANLAIETGYRLFGEVAKRSIEGIRAKQVHAGS